MKDEGATFDNRAKETVEALIWFRANTYVKDDVLYWNGGAPRARARSGVYAWKPAGCVSPRGYIQVRMYSEKFMAHRIIWALYYGCWPKNGIDHINGLKTDNHIENMREVTQFENSKNAAKYPRQEDWIATGVDKRPSGFAVYGQANKKRHYLGMRKCHTAAMFLKLRFDIEHGFSSRHGQRAS